MKAIIRLDVPEWQIGQEVKVYFPDTMCVKGICKDEERPKGKWINGLNGTFECSRCGIKHSKAHFCPNCGAQMER